MLSVTRPHLNLVTVLPSKVCDKARVCFLFSPMKSQASGRNTMSAPRLLASVTSSAAWQRLASRSLVTFIWATAAMGLLRLDMLTLRRGETLTGLSLVRTHPNIGSLSGNTVISN